MKEVLYVICPNGYGHVKRSLAISEAILDRFHDLKFTFFVHPSSAQYLDQYTSKQLRSSSTQIITDPKLGFSLQHLSQPNFKANFHHWTVQLGKTIDAFAYDLVLSDNLATPLEFFSNTILTGSFLWHTILDRNEKNDKVLKREEELIEKYKPKMIHIAGMGMPALINTTNALPVPWITSKFAAVQTDTPRILVTAGRSGSNRDIFQQVATTLATQSPLLVFANKDMKDALGLNQIQTFDFTDDSFSKLSLLIARPGIGILSDAIKYNIPVLTHSAFVNKELCFNAKKIQDLQIGKMINLLDTEHLLSTVANLVDKPEIRQKLLEGLNQQQVGGATVAAKAIIQHL